MSYDTDKTLDLMNNEETDRQLLRAVQWKLDIRLLPAFTILFTLSQLDRINIGNAKVLGLQHDLGISSHQYAIALAVFYAFYIVSEVPSNLLVKRITPRIWLPLLAVLWGGVSLAIGFTRNFRDVTIARSVLGIVEGGLFPGIVLHLSTCYTRDDIAIRLGGIYVAAPLAGAFGGLLARGLHAIRPVGVIDASWRWIFVIEGLMTIIIGGLTYFLIPNSIEDASFLTAEEKVFARGRLNAIITSNDDFAWSEVLRGCLSIQLWLTATAYFCLLACSYSFSLFLPTIVTNLGYTAVDAQLFSVPPYVAGCAVTLAVGLISDRLKTRGAVMLCVLPVGIVGYAIIANVDSNRARYAATFLISIGTYPAIPCILAWLAGNSAGHYKRATVTALQLAIANAGGFVATFSYPVEEASTYFHRSHTVNMSLLCCAWVTILLNVVYCRWVNQEKREGRYERWIGSGDDRDPGFKMVL